MTLRLKFQPNHIRLVDFPGTMEERILIGMDLVKGNKLSDEKLIVKIEV